MQTIITLISICVALLLEGQVWAAPVKAKFVRQGDSASIELEGASPWIYHVQKVKIGDKSAFELDAPAFDIIALKNISNWKSPTIAKVEAVVPAPEGRTVLRFFPVSEAVEFFDYQTDQPSRLILDFYIEENSKNKKTADAVSKPKKVVKAPVQEQNGSASGRAPASDALAFSDKGALKVATNTAPTSTELQSGVYDGADPGFSRFSIQDFEIKEEAIIASKQNLYMEFPMMRLDLTSLQTLMQKQPNYEIEAKDTDENKQARLLLTLFNNKRYNVLLKSANWFFEKYPKSEYEEIARALVADAQFALWRKSKEPSDFDTSILNYRQFVEKFPESPLKTRDQLLMGFATLERGDYLNAIRYFQVFLRDQPKSPHFDLVQLAIAEAHLKLNQFDSAIDIYKKVSLEGKNLIDRQRAAYFIGDSFYKKKDYPAAIQSYQTAIQQYPEAVREFPNAFYNQAAAYFETEKYRESLNSYREFLTRFPESNYAGYAMTRVGELLEILGADESRVAGAFLETTFRYGDDPTAVVARLRLLSSRFKGMKPKEVEKAAEEIMSLAQKSQLPNIQQFATLTVANGFNKRGEFDKSTDILVKYYQANPTTADTKLLTSRIMKNINDKIREQVEKNNFLGALDTYDHFSQSWLKNSTRIDTKYLIGRAYEQAGAQKEAEKLYRNAINKIYSMAGTKAGRETNIFEKLPSTDEVNLRLASVTFLQKKLNEANEFLANIKNPEKLSEPQQIERIQLAAYLLEQRGDLSSAVRYLTDVLKVHKGIPSLLAAPYFDLGVMETKMSRKEDAIKSFKRVDELFSDSSDVDPNLHAQALEKMGNLELELGQKTAAIAAFENLLERYDKKMQLNAVRYRLGKIWFDQGEIKKATAVWRELPTDGTATVWSKLAKENLTNSQWKDDYQKYMQRIPAMAKEATQKPDERSQQ